MVEHIDIAFDGCDEVDEKLYVLKSGGGIHTKEKLIAALSDEYVLLVDESKCVETLTCRYPIVLEVLEDDLKYIEKEVTKLGGRIVIRSSSAKDGFTISENGNLLMDVRFETIEDWEKLECQLKNIKGVIETSLFTDVVTKAIVISEQGIRIISKNI